MPLDNLPLDSLLLAEKAREPDRFLVILETTTREKVELYQMIARELDLPIQFRSLNELIETFHAAEEDTGKREANAYQKLFEADKSARPLYNPESPYYKLLQEKCLEWGVVFNPDNVFLAADDTTIEVLREVWGPFKKVLTPYVPDALLKSADNGGLTVGPGAETGPISAATGAARLFELYRQAACVACIPQEKDTIYFTRTLLVRSLTEAALGAPPQAFNASTTLHPHVPDGEPIFDDPNVPILYTEHFVQLEVNSRAAIAANMRQYLATLSPASEIVRRFALMTKERTSLHREDRTAVLRAAERKVTMPNKHKIVCANKILPPQINRKSDFYHALKLAEPFKNADMHEFHVFDYTNEKVRRYNYYKLLSAIVAKQTDAAYMNVPIIVHDDGCWGPAIRLLIEQANKGMSKDFPRLLYEGKLPVGEGLAAKHFATSYIDVIEGQDEIARNIVAAQVKAIRFQNYSPFREPRGKEIAKSNAKEEKANASLKAIARKRKRRKPEGLFTVAVFTSANNDNRKLIKTLYKYGSYLAKTRIGLRWGAGDRHAMGAVFDGYWSVAESVKDNTLWLAGFTTRQIAESETRFGRPPDVCDFPQQYSANIYQRMADMLEADAIVVAPGGPGTTQELIAALVLHDLMPEKMKNKPTIIYSPDIHANYQNTKDLYWENAIRALKGDAFWEQLVNNPHQGVDGIYLATNLRDLKNLTDEFKTRHDKSHNSLCSDKPPITKRRALDARKPAVIRPTTV